MRQPRPREPGELARSAAASRSNVNVPPLGDWSTQTQDPWVLLDAVGAEVVRQRGEAGDMEALFSWGAMVLRCR